MSKKTDYRQCVLEQWRDDKRAKIVSFIPKKFAKLGGVVKLQDDYGRWSDGWVVTFVGETSGKIPDIQKAVRTHRENTGDSLPKEPKDEADRRAVAGRT